MADRFNRSGRPGPMRARVNHVLRDLACMTPLSFIKRNFDLNRGVVLRMERVRPDLRADFSPNTHRETTPEYLESLILRAQKTGFDIISLHEGVARMTSKTRTKKFICLTFDGAYKEHLDYLLPLMKKYDLPITIFTATYWQEGEGLLWWWVLEEIIAKQDAVALEAGGETAYIESRTLRQKYRAFNIFEDYILSLNSPDRRAYCKHLAHLYGVDVQATCRELMMDWGELRGAAKSKNITIGSLGLDHLVLDQADAEQVETDIRESLMIMEAQLGQRPSFFAYQDLSTQMILPSTIKIAQRQNLTSAFTLRRGAVLTVNKLDLFDLPRVSPTGNGQRTRYMDMHLSGALASLF